MLQNCGLAGEPAHGDRRGEDEAGQGQLLQVGVLDPGQPRHVRIVAKQFLGVSNVRLESPFPEHALPRVWVWCEQFRRRVADDFSPKTLDEFVAHARANWDQSWGIYVGEELGGIITWRAWSPVCGELHIICRQDFWGRERTDAAAVLAMADVFASGAIKVMGVAFAENKQVRGMLRRLGFSREGVLRKHTLHRGRPVDVTLYGLTKQEFDTKWLSSLADRS
jgi:RimJ/RimL family protein N-acetyltransferase